MGHFFYLKLLFWRPWGSILGTWDTILVILDPGGHPMDTLRPRCPFLSILGWILGVSWDPLWSQFRDFLWFGVTKWETVSRSVFLVIQGWKWCQNAMAVCAINTVKHYGFEWFHFFHLFSNLESWGRIFVTCWCLLVTLGPLFLICDALGDRLNFCWFLRDPLEGTRLRGYTQSKQTVLSVSLVSRSANPRLLICKQLNADTRLANC